MVYHFGGKNSANQWKRESIEVTLKEGDFVYKDDVIPQIPVGLGQNFCKVLKSGNGENYLIKNLSFRKQAYQPMSFKFCLVSASCYF